MLLESPQAASQKVSRFGKALQNLPSSTREGRLLLKQKMSRLSGGPVEGIHEAGFTGIKNSDPKERHPREDDPQHHPDWS